MSITTAIQHMVTFTRSHEALWVVWQACCTCGWESERGPTEFVARQRDAHLADKW